MRHSYTVGQHLGGYRIDRIIPIDDIRATGIELLHEGTLSRHIHLLTTDDNNLFSVTFRTPPTDSTGVAHILEHTALCGSKRFPVRDPFFSMTKRSLRTFMNALTSDDWTMYPFSTRNRKDYYNLLGVYLDAAFFPNLSELDFKQEGHRLDYEADAGGGPNLVFKGVVYNEMRGAMSDPQSFLSHRLAKALFPTTTYGHNSGGDPWEIPDLTWEGLKEFHRRYYHPSNARFFTSGNLALEEQLDFIEKAVLSRFGPLRVDSAVGSEPRFGAPVSIEESYPVAPGDDIDHRSMVQVAWRSCALPDSYEVLTMRVLAALLLGNSAAPLYKALLDSRLGSQLAAGTGYQEKNRDTVFAAGLQGVGREQAGRVEGLVLSTLQELAGKGFPQEPVEAVIHRMEFNNREIVCDRFPYPLLLLFRMVGSWIHDGDPFLPLLVSQSFSRLREDTRKAGFFERLITERLLKNPHRVTFALHPDPEMRQREEDRLSQRLRRIDDALGPEDRKEIRKQADLLKTEQETVPDHSCLPALALEDINREESVALTRVGELQGGLVQWCPQCTNGISYLAFQFDLSRIPPDLSPWAAFFAQALTQVGAAGLSFSEMAERMEAVTGGISATAEIVEGVANLNQVGRVLEVRARMLDRNVRPTCKILADMLLGPDFSDLHRLETLVGQEARSLENSVPRAGHRYAAGRAARYLTLGGYLREEWRGIEQIRRMKAMASGTEGDRGALAEKLLAIAGHLVHSSGLRVAVTAEEGRFPEIEAALAGLIGRIGAPAPKMLYSPGQLTPTDFRPEAAREGWSASVAVSYVTRVFRTVPYAHPDGGALMVLAKLLSNGYLHREIREKGGAYGGMAVASLSSGLFSLMSYRDPNFEKTYEVFDSAVTWVAEGGCTDENIREAILGVFSDLDGVLSPEGKGLRELRYMYQGITPEDRQKLRDRILSVNRQHLVEAAGRYLCGSGIFSAETAIANAGVFERARQRDRFKHLVVSAI